MQNKYIVKAIQCVGSQVGLASILGVRAVTVYQWKNCKRPVPIGRAIAIEQATDGQVTRRDLRPKDWHLIWPELVDGPIQIAAPAARNDAEVCP